MKNCTQHVKKVDSTLQANTYQTKKYTTNDKRKRNRYTKKARERNEVYFSEKGTQKLQSISGQMSGTDFLTLLEAKLRRFH